MLPARNRISRTTAISDFHPLFNFSQFLPAGTNRPKPAREGNARVALMNDELEKRIQEQDDWTFKECLGLAAEFNLKTRAVILTVLANGKNYIDGERVPPADAGDD